jgi:hypothetical protein
MSRMYLEAWRLTLNTGIVHHVDHIVPLKSPTVCGLHCEANLRVLQKTDNLKKGNKHCSCGNTCHPSAPCDTVGLPA